jgi:Ser-tRNA(Ala) deacylase AlaX
MATRLLYLEKFDVISGDAAVAIAVHAEDGRTDVQLDATCFYPRGGGQDWDTGTISVGSATFVVEEVRLDENGVAHHFGRYESGNFTPGEKVHCQVDEARRRTNTRLHSAGHLVDMTVDALKLPWTPGRGAHFPHMSFVEYEAPGTEATDEVKQQIQTKLDEFSRSTYENKIMFLPIGEMGNYCRHIPPNIPTNKPSRVVLYADDFGIPCGGTHVRRVADIGKITITKLKAKNGLIKVSYAVEGIN